jgi:hypothetical protein
MQYHADTTRDAEATPAPTPAPRPPFVPFGDRTREHEEKQRCCVGVKSRKTGVVNPCTRRANTVTPDGWRMCLNHLRSHRKWWSVYFADETNLYWDKSWVLAHLLYVYHN